MFEILRYRQLMVPQEYLSGKFFSSDLQNTKIFLKMHTRNQFSSSH